MHALTYEKVQVDKGAIKFVLKGANIMCPGLTSPGGHMDDAPKDAVVQVDAQLAALLAAHQCTA